MNAIYSDSAITTKFLTNHKTKISIIIISHRLARFMLENRDTWRYPIIPYDEAWFAHGYAAFAFSPVTGKHIAVKDFYYA